MNAKKNILIKSSERAERSNTTRLYVKKSDAEGMEGACNFDWRQERQEGLSSLG